MNLALNIAAMRRGACPTLDAPMQTGDGLLARIRPVGARIDPEELGQLAALAGHYGNGIVEITARGNLQVRGLKQADVPVFAAAVRDVIAVETGLVVETPPLAGDDPDDLADPRPLAAAIKLGALMLEERLGPKVAVVVDGQGQIGLGDLKADVRLVALSLGQWGLEIGGVWRGATTDPVACALQALTTIASLGPMTRGKDISHLAFGDLVTPVAEPRRAPASPIGSFHLREGEAFGFALPYGALGWQDMKTFADTAKQAGINQMRLAPQHGLLVHGASEALRDAASSLVLITTPSDPRARISACIGSAGCASGFVPARDVADVLAPKLDSIGRLHVSGCAKGCAHPRAADVTLVGRADGYGLVINGTAGDTAQAVLRADQVAGAFAQAQG